MKYSIKILYAILFALSLHNCKNEPIMFDRSKTYVGFDFTRVNMLENGTSVDIPFMIAGFEGSEDITVNYEISVDGISRPAVEGVDFTSGSTGTVDFPKGAGYSKITIYPVDNDVLTGNKSFRINITANSKNLPMGRENSVLVVIRDDEHPLFKWIGNYNVNAVSYYLPGDYDENWNDVITDSDPDNFDNLLITGIGNSNANTIKATVNLDDMSITLAPGQLLGDIYNRGDVVIYKGTESASIDDLREPIIGTIEDDGTILIDLWGEAIVDSTGKILNIWDVFNTTWTKQ